MIDLELNEKQESIRLKAKNFANQYIAPFTKQLENDLDLREQIYRGLAAEGFLLLSNSYKQAKIDYFSYALMLAEIAKVDAGISVSLSIMNMVTELIEVFGSSYLKEKYLPEILAGNYLPLSFALTEKDAGSDVKNIQTRAKKEKNGYILNGKKQFITNADAAKLILVLAKTAIDQFSIFLLDRNVHNICIIKKEDKLGLLSANLIDFEMKDLFIEDKYLLGEIGEGFHMAFHGLNAGRVGIAAQSLGIAEAAFESALKYSKERVQFDEPLCDHQAIAFKLADMHVKLNAAWGLVEKACFHLNNKDRSMLSCSTAKLYATESANEIVNEALQIFGGYGYIKDHPIERYFRDVRVTTLYEGTSEIQRIIISREILK